MCDIYTLTLREYELSAVLSGLEKLRADLLSRKTDSLYELSEVLELIDRIEKLFEK